jgi:hypothetical protein
MGKQDRFSKLVALGVAMLSVTMICNRPVLARDRNETIDAQAFGTGTQMGQNIGVTLNIQEFSTPADRTILVQAFEKGQNQGLVHALQKMRAVGHIEITGTLGYDCAFIQMEHTSTGRRIVFVTNRQIKFAEEWTDSQTMSFDLTAGVLELNDQDKSKSTGKLFPAAQLIINKEGKPQWDLNQNAWDLRDIIDWKGTPGVN